MFLSQTDIVEAGFYSHKAIQNSKKKQQEELKIEDALEAIACVAIITYFPDNVSQILEVVEITPDWYDTVVRRMVSIKFSFFYVLNSNSEL